MAARSSQNQTSQYKLEVYDDRPSNIFEQTSSKKSTTTASTSQAKGEINSLDHIAANTSMKPFAAEESRAEVAPHSFDELKHPRRKHTSKPKKRQDGSLLSLFQSEFFNIHMLF